MLAGQVPDRAVGDRFVYVHVETYAGSRLVNIPHKLVVESAACNILRGLDDRYPTVADVLSRAGYVETKQLRAARAGLEMTAVRATPKAVDLVDGRIADDPGVAL